MGVEARFGLPSKSAAIILPSCGMRGKCLVNGIINKLILARGNLPVSRAGSDGRRNTSLIDWAHNTFNEEPLFWLSSIRPKQGCVFFKSAFAN
jgi:hypothetical protein